MQIVGAAAFSGLNIQATLTKCYSFIFNKDKVVKERFRELESRPEPH